MSKYDRTNFLDKVTINGRNEYDLLDCHFDLLQIVRPLYLYECTFDDIGRPDRISRNIYKGDQQYWWIVLKYNNICDVYNEIYVTKRLYAPNEKDIQDWFLKVNRINK
jgi:uncharacterized protein YprB with RNaseH-like and TPR domain